MEVCQGGEVGCERGHERCGSVWCPTGWVDRDELQRGVAGARGDAASEGLTTVFESNLLKEGKKGKSNWEETKHTS